MRGAYYNEYDRNAAAWLRELIRQGHIAPGDVDERSIEDVHPDDLKGYAQCHFFAGIGVWSYALRRAGWADDRPVWTGSCPCQPFSAAGKGAGFADERHLWPAFHHLIRECAPAIVLGEQVASRDGLGWLDLVSADLEGSGYACGAVDLCAAGVGAPHIRQRLWWVAERMADADDAGPQGRRQPGRERAAERAAGPGGVVGGLGDAKHTGRAAIPSGHDRSDDATGVVPGRGEQKQSRQTGVELGGLADTDDADGCGELRRLAQNGSGMRQGGRGAQLDLARSVASRPDATDSPWRDADWLYCRDGKWRPVEPGTFPLAHGAAARVGRLRGYGNAIAAPAAQAFIESVMDSV